MLDESPFERVVRTHRRPGYVVEPVSITWDAVAFNLRGDRDAVACIPRGDLAAFFSELESGALDERIQQFLATPSSGRVLQVVDQAGTPGLFDELSSPGAIAPPERRPGRPGLFGRGGGTPQGPRQDKRSRPPRPRRLLVGTAVATVVVAAAAIAVAVTQGDDKPAAVVAVGPAATTTTTTTTVAPATVPTVCKQFDVAGSWNLTNDGGFAPVVVIQQSGTALTGSMTLSDAEFQRSGWVTQSNPLTGTLSGDRLLFDVIAPHQDGFVSDGQYEGTVTDAGASGTARDVALANGPLITWSMTGSSTRCVSR